MTAAFESDSLLAPYRVLDLTEGGSLVGGKILADLGADVVKIEPPGGSPTRRLGPFYKGEPDPEKSLFWLAYNLNKRAITLNIESADGRALFLSLVKKADIVLESYPPGYLDSLGLGYHDLSAVKPDLILTSITPYGQNGPYAQFKSSDLTAWASGGMMYISGDPDRAPVALSVPQAYLHGGAEGAAASMIALWHRNASGKGHQVDVSVQQCVIWTTLNVTGAWDMNQFDVMRASGAAVNPNGRLRTVFPCKDGYITVFIMGGGNAAAVESVKKLVVWMDEEGRAPAWLKTFDWVKEYDLSLAGQEIVDRVEQPFEEFFLSKTKAELNEGALARGLLLVPVSDTKDVAENAQLQARNFWVKVEHPELDDTLVYCGAFNKLSETPWQLRRRAPRIGEHNQEVYRGELGLSKERLALLVQAGVI